MRNIALAIVLVFFYSFSHCQPGGGGDLIIASVLDENGQPILNNNRAYDFELLPIKENQEFHTYPLKHTFYQSDSTPVSVSFVLNKYYPKLLVTKGEDMMLIEFVDMLGENGGGADDYIPSMPFIPGYEITVSRGFHEGEQTHIPDPSWLGEENSKNKHQNQTAGLVRKSALSSFQRAKLAEISVPRAYRQALLYNQVLKRHNESIELSQWVLPSVEDAFIRMHLIGNIFYCYLSLRKNNEARLFYLQNKEELMALIGGSSLIYFLEKLGLQQEVLEVHNELCNQSDYPWYWYHRGYFKLNTLNDPIGAISDLDFVLQQCPSHRVSKGDIFEYCEFSRAYFQKGLAQLKVNQIDMGVENLLNSSYYYINTTLLPSYIKSIDSLLVYHPYHSTLQLTAALLYSKSAVEQPLNSTLYYQHIDQAQKALTRVKDGEGIFLWWMIRANLQRAMMKPHEAIQSTEEALKIDPNAKSVYRMQYVIYTTQLPLESDKIREAYNNWTND